MTKVIEILVSPKGETTVQTRGFTGGECREASKFLEQTLGQRISERLTSEFHAGHRVEQQACQRQ